MKRLFLILALLYSSSALAETAVTKIADGRAALTAHDMPAAKARFAEAVGLDPTNQTAQALLGITRLFDITSKLDTGPFLDGLGVDSAGRDVYRWDASLAQDVDSEPVLPADYNSATMATYWQNVMVPESVDARANLALVTDTNFLLTLTASETTMPVSVNLDYADILMARACLRAAEFLANLGSGQNLTANLEDLYQVAKGDMLTFQRIINDNPNFLTVGDTAKRTAAKTALQDMIGLYRQASTAIRARPAGVNRLFMLDPADLPAEAEFRLMLDRIEQSITAPADMGGAYVYTGPMFESSWNLKALLPPFSATGFDVTTIPDASLGGVISGMTKEGIAAMLSDRYETVADMGWEWVSPTPQGNTMGQYLALASGKHLAIGNAGTYLTSADGINWTVGRLPGVGQLRSAVEHSGRIVMVTYDGSIHVSDDDAVTWRRVFSDAGSGFHGVAYGGGQYVAVGDYGLIATSADGETWNSYYPNGISMLNVLYNGSLFVAVGVDETNGNAVISTSADGTLWTQRLNTNLSGGFFWGVARNGSTLVAVGGNVTASGSNKLAYSTDGGLNWTTGPVLASPTGNIGFNGVAYVNGKFVAVGTAATIATSADGVTWATATSGETFLNFIGVGGNGATTYVTSGGGVILSSADNITFARSMTPAFQTAGGIANPAILALRSIDGYLYAGGGTTVAGNAVILRSSDGQSFSPTTVPGTANDITDIIKQGATYYAVGRSGTILTSPDGATWTQIISGNAGSNTPSHLNAIAYLNGKFIAVGSASRILTSPDGATNNWTSITTPLGGMQIFGVAYGNGTYVAVGGSNNPNSPLAYILSSTDAITWSQRTPWTTNTFRGVVFHGGVFTAVGVNGQVSRSEDGVNWYSVGSGDIQTNLTSISVLDGRYYATLAAGSLSGAFESQTALLISSDGEEWVRVTQGTANGPNRVELFGNRLYTGNGGATIMRTQALTALAAPTVTILTPPAAGTSVAQGTNLALVASSTGEGIVTYQWKKDGVDIMDATDAGLTLDNIQGDAAGNYTVVVTNAAGSDTSGTFAVTVSATAVAPAITSHPEAQTLSVGMNAMLSVETTGTIPFTYVWKKDGVTVTNTGNYTGADTAALTITGLTADNGGAYTVEVTNAVSSDTSLPAVLTVDGNATYDFTTLAGLAYNPGTTDDTGAAARFNNPHGVAVDASGNIYVSSPTSHTIRMVTSAGVVTTLAGQAGVSGSTDGIGSAASFNQPHGLALDAAGTTLYVADAGGNRVRKINLSTQEVTTLTSLAYSLNALVVDGTGNVYYTSWDHTIRKLTPDGLTISLFAGSSNSPGIVDGTGSAARFNNPVGITRDAAGNLYVADSGNACIRKITTGGAFGVVTTYAGVPMDYGFNDGPAGSATLSSPLGLAVDALGNVFVTDNSASTVRKISPARSISTIGGLAYWMGASDGAGADARFANPAGLALDAAGNLYLADNSSHIIRKGVPLTSPLAPVVASSPQNQNVAVGEDVSFGVTGVGAATLTYQWRKNGVDLSDGGGVSGATTFTLSLANVQTADAGSYAVLVTNGQGSALSAPAALTVTVPPAITVQPVTASVTSGQAVNLSVTATDTGDVTYQWRRNGMEIAGAIYNTYSIPAATRSNAAVYDVVINGVSGSIVSGPTLVRVAPTSYPGELTVDPAFSASPLLTLSTRIFTAIALPGGKWMVGGEFVRWDSTPRTFIARLNSDYSLDAGFTPPLINGFVYALALSPAADGSIYVGGEFTAVDGHMVPGLFRLNSEGTLDLTWRAQDAPPHAAVTALTVQADGKPLVARAATLPDHTATTGTNVLRRLNTDGTLDGTFSVNIVTNNNRLNAVIAESGGDVVFAGAFGSVNAVSRNGLARVDATGAVLDAAFGGAAGTNNQVYSLTSLSGGRYLIGGAFGQVAGTGRNRAAIISADGSLDGSFAPGSFNGNVLGAAMQGDGRIILAGTFSTAGGSPTDGLVRLTPSGDIDTLYPTGASASSFSTVSASRSMFVFPQGDGTTALFGGFQAALNQQRIGVAVVAANGTLAASPAPLLYRPSYANSAFVLPGNQTMYFGSIDAAGASGPLGQVVRLNADGSLDGAFPAGSGFNPNGLSRFGIYRAVQQGDGKFLAVGDFAGFNGQPGYRMLRINPDGTHDDTFDAGSGPNLLLPQMLALSGGRTLLYNLATSFTYNGTPIARVTRLEVDGSVDYSFNIGGGFLNGANSAVPNVAYEQPDGKIVLAGAFTSYNGITANGLVRLNPDGSHDATFDAGSGPVATSGSTVIGIIGLPDGRLVINGNLTTYDTNPVNRVAILSSTGTLDGSFTGPVELNAAVSQVLPQEDGKFILLGDFTGTTTPFAVRVSATGAVDPTFLLRGITSSGFGTTRIIMGDDGSLYVYGSMPMSHDYGVPVAVARFSAAPVTPGVATPPASVTTGEGTTATFSVRAAGTAPYTYQWRHNATDIPGATYSVLNIDGVVTGDAGSYDVVVTNSVSSVTSAAATLTVDSLLQTINFTDPLDTPFSTTPVTLTATASSGLTVTFSIVSGPAVMSGADALTLNGAGTVVVRASQAGDATFAAAPDVDQSIEVSPNFGSWLYDVFDETERGNPLVSGPTAVFGQDGLPNLVKYALGLDPKVNATSGLPEVTTDATYWLYTYTRPTDRADLIYTVQYSTNLTTWTDIPLGTEHAVIASGGGTETWRARYALASAANLYFRLKVTQ